MTSSADAAGAPSPWRARFALVCSRPVIRKALIAAVVVGSILIVLNQGDLIFSGRLTGRILLKSLITPVIPFCVTMLGAVLNSGASARAADLRPGWAAIRRSIIIAIIVGGVIIAAFILHRIAKASAIRNRVPHWASWNKREFPMGLALAPTLLFYLIIAALQG